MTGAIERHKGSVSPRDKLVVLALINTLQPVTTEELIRRLPRSFEAGKLEQILTLLGGRNMVKRFANDQHVVTVLGRAVLGSGPMAKERDIGRMLHLFERNKGGGERP